MTDPTTESERRVLVPLRRSWVRSVIAVVAVASSLVATALCENAAVVRTALTAVLPSTVFLFTVLAGLVTYLISNHVRGIHAEALQTIARARERIWAYRDKYRESTDPVFERIFVLNLLDLASKKEEEWFEPNNIRGWSEDLDKHLQQVEAPEARVELFSRYLLPVGEAVDELTVLYVRSVIADLDVKTVARSAGVVVLAILVNIVARLLHGGEPSDLIAVGILVAAITFAVLELLLVYDLVMGHVGSESYTFRKAEAAWSAGNDRGDATSERSNDDTPHDPERPNAA